MRSLVVVAVILSAVGCGAPVELVDSGVVDSGGEPEIDWRWDGGFDEEPDSGQPPVEDAGEFVDAGETDAGFTDAGPSDAGSFDAGRPDAGRPDSGVPDAGTRDAGPPSSRHIGRTLGSTDAGNGFFEYLPPGYGDGTPRPLLVFWHGIGENGDGDAGLQDLRQVLVNGPPRLINQNTWSNALPFVVLSPQHRGSGCPSSNEIRNFIAWATARYDVDPKRIYLTALSCGAVGSWNYIGNNTDTQITAAVLICGDPGNPNNASSTWGRTGCTNLGRLPIWAFHGTADTVVPITNARETMNRLIACPMPPRKDARFTIYPDAGHDTWTRTYNLSAGHDIYTWLLSQSKP